MFARTWGKIATDARPCGRGNPERSARGATVPVPAAARSARAPRPGRRPRGSFCGTCRRLCGGPSKKIQCGWSDGWHGRRFSFCIEMQEFVPLFATLPNKLGTLFGSAPRGFAGTGCGWGDTPAPLPEACGRINFFLSPSVDVRGGFIV